MERGRMGDENKEVVRGNKGEREIEIRREGGIEVEIQRAFHQQAFLLPS